MQQLPIPASQIVRKILYENWDSSRVDGYDATQSDPSQSDFIPLTTDWFAFGDTYPSLTLSNFSGDTIGGGTTGYTGLQGDGSGLNKTQSHRGLLTIQAEDEETYLNGNDAEQILHLLTNHVEQILQENGDGNLTDKNGTPIGFRPYGSNPYGSGTFGGGNYFWWVEFEENDAPTTTEADRALFQKQYTIGVGWLNEP